MQPLHSHTHTLAHACTHTHTLTETLVYMHTHPHAYTKTLRVLVLRRAVFGIGRFTCVRLVRVRARSGIKHASCDTNPRRDGPLSSSPHGRFRSFPESLDMGGCGLNDQRGDLDLFPVTAHSPIPARWPITEAQINTFHPSRVNGCHSAAQPESGARR